MIKLLIILFIILTLFISIKIKFDMRYDKNKLDFKVYIFNFDITKMIIKTKKTKKNGEELVKSHKERRAFDTKISLRIFREILSRIKYLKRKPKFIITNILEFGVEDADVTAVLYGHICTIVYSIFGIISCYAYTQNSKIDVIPKYNTTLFKLHFEGILKIKIAQIIYITFLFITLGRKLNGTTSNRKLNENYS
ncbi:hypothetical protein SFBM_0587 [Candidatus Arthromitus sp. SFB-mouse-Japan]|uniref:DUF2953 domain-containing protein n=1 Tax=Candidatus Arthromitus sp. SFB-mouse TaxID=49118 RepID=UPI00021B7FAC|nr:DUF2953 domain-containing protein [Candidatus Arthromitus sp. SFB-mouse]BAK56365.1 hypothetical protein SFBM_0587 [Candidatus Arthromitus sp. SFB-mouse-Japan]